MTKLPTHAKFTWLWNQRWFLESEQGNFVWLDPEYGGDNTIHPYQGSLVDYLEEINLDFGRGKGTKPFPNGELVVETTEHFKALMTADGRMVVFNEPKLIGLAFDCNRWTATINCLLLDATGKDTKSALHSLADEIANECSHLISTPTGRLSKAEVKRKGLYIGIVDLGTSEIGLGFQGSRWIVGTVDDRVFYPVQDFIEPVTLCGGVKTPPCRPTPCLRTCKPFGATYGPG